MSYESKSLTHTPEPSHSTSEATWNEVQMFIRFGDGGTRKKKENYWNKRKKNYAKRIPKQRKARNCSNLVRNFVYSVMLSLFFFVTLCAHPKLLTAREREKFLNAEVFDSHKVFISISWAIFCTDTYRMKLVLIKRNWRRHPQKFKNPARHIILQIFDSRSQFFCFDYNKNLNVPGIKVIF